MLTHTAALTAYRASGRAVVDTVNRVADPEGVLPDVAVTTPALFVVPLSLLPVPVELLDEDELTEGLAGLEDSLR